MDLLLHDRVEVGYRFPIFGKPTRVDSVGSKRSSLKRVNVPSSLR